MFCWILSGNYYAGISRAYVLTFDAAENTKKETCKLILLWQETHLEPFNLATLMVHLEVTQW